MHRICIDCFSLEASRHRLRHANHCTALSGTSGFTSITILSRSATTLSPDFSPIFLISSRLRSASWLASSSAFLLPLEC